MVNTFSLCFCLLGGAKRAGAVFFIVLFAGQCETGWYRFFFVGAEGAFTTLGSAPLSDNKKHFFHLRNRSHLNQGRYGFATYFLFCFRGGATRVANTCSLCVCLQLPCAPSNHP